MRRFRIRRVLRDIFRDNQSEAVKERTAQLEVRREEIRQSRVSPLRKFWEGAMYCAGVIGTVSLLMNPWQALISHFPFLQEIKLNLFITEEFITRLVENYRKLVWPIVKFFFDWAAQILSLIHISEPTRPY